MPRLALVILVLALAATAPEAALAQEQEPEPRERVPGPGREASAPFRGLSAAATDEIVVFLRRTKDTCDWLPREYRIDCIRVVFRDMAARLPRTGEYAPVRQALSEAADGLERLVTANLDPTVESRNLSVGNRRMARRLPAARPVRLPVVPTVEREAEAIIAEASTVLLRSAENSERRRVHFQEIAAAIDSTKVLLRSG